MMAAFVLCRDITFSKRIQKTTRCKDLLFPHESSFKEGRSAQKRRKKKKSGGPGSGDDVEDGDDGGDVDCAPLGDLDLGNEHGCGDDHAVEDECDEVSRDLTDEEEAVENVHLLPEGHFLRLRVAINRQAIL